MIGLKLLTLKKNTAGEAPTVRILLKESKTNVQLYKEHKKGKLNRQENEAGERPEN